MSDHASAESGDREGPGASGFHSRRARQNRRRFWVARGRRFFHRHIRDCRGRYHSGFPARLLARGELQILPRRTGRRLHISPFIALYDVRFFRMLKSYVWQSALAAFAMLAVLLMVDSIADAALAAGLASSAVIVFLHPRSRSATLRHLIGGHLHGLVVGVAGSLLMFHSTLLPVPADLSHWVADVVAAAALGLVILVMAITDTEHPPAAAATLGFALQSLDWTLVLLFAAAVLVLALVNLAMRRRLQDLID